MTAYLGMNWPATALHEEPQRPRDLWEVAPNAAIILFRNAVAGSSVRHTASK